MKILSTKRIAAYSDNSLPTIDFMQLFKACAKLSDYKVLRKEDYSLDNYPSFIGYSHITASALQSKAVSIFKSLNLAPKISRRKERIFVVVKFINAENNQPASAWVQLIPIGTSDDTIIDFTVTISTEYDEI